jgi:hypothetical protein
VHGGRSSLDHEMVQQNSRGARRRTEVGGPFRAYLIVTFTQGFGPGVAGQKEVP